MYYFNKLVNIRLCDITRHEGMITIHLPSGEMNLLSKGEQVAIAQTSNVTCPVAMLEKYMLRTGMEWNQERLLFRSICKAVKTEKLRQLGSISNSCLRELFRKKLREFDYDPVKFGLHSLRADGATAAANNGVPDRLFKRQGGWKSDSAKDGYVYRRLSETEINSLCLVTVGD